MTIHQIYALERSLFCLLTPDIWKRIQLPCPSYFFTYIYSPVYLSDGYYFCSVDIAEDKISIFDSGPGMDCNDENCLVKWYAVVTLSLEKVDFFCPISMEFGLDG